MVVLNEETEAKVGSSSRLRGETILLVSPQPWSFLYISKRHYAVELARRGCTVFFLEPPSGKGPFRPRITPVAGHPQLYRIEHRLPFPLALRFHARPLHDLLMRVHVGRLVRALDRPVDVLWCFDANLYADLRWFEADLRIFHPVDPVSERTQIDVARSADVVFSVSEAILGRFRHLAVPAHFVNHGLAEAFAAAARQPLRVERKAGPVRVGYAGNLTHGAVDTRVFRRVVERHPGVEFHLWGSSDVADPSSEAATFVAFLRAQPNVRLHGWVDAEYLALAFRDVDCFLIAYRSTRSYDCSNSHKVLEYLSTGKVVVSSRLSTYTSYPDLLEMAEREDGSDVPEKFDAVLADLSSYNSDRLQRFRRSFALDHSYGRQLERILSLLPAQAEGGRSGRGNGTVVGRAEPTSSTHRSEF